MSLLITTSSGKSWRRSQSRSKGGGKASKHSTDTTSRVVRELAQKGTKMAKKWTFLVMAPIILLAQFQSVDAIFNCLTPNMFKMGKGNQPSLVYGAERANWYPQTQFQQAAGYPNTYQQGYGQNPMKLLFQPKWKGGSGMFGGMKGAWGGWKMGANTNFYRPALGYGYNYNYGPASGYMQATPAGSGYQFSEQLNVAPFSVPPIAPHLTSSYSSAALGNNDGWSVPLNTYSQPIQQTQINTYDSAGYTSLPPKQQANAANILSPYGATGGTKGGGGPSNKLTTTKNVLLADGGYDFYDAHLVGPKNQTYGHAYPDWYSGTVDSPAKVAQQLFKYGLRKQRLQQQQQQQQNKSAPLIQLNTDLSRPSGSQFTILDEPRFVGFGSVDTLNSREARLSCSFNEAIDQTNRPLWVKFLGPYNSSQVINNSKIGVPPFNCVNSQCRTQEVESTKDYRYKFDNGPATSTLIISEPRLSDYGIYRCSALTKAINNNPLETVYQIVRFGNNE